MHMDTIENVMRGLEAARCKAMLDANEVALRQLLDSTLVYVHSTGAQDSLESLLDKITKGTVRYLELDIQVEDIQASSHFCIISGAMQANILLNQSPLQVASRYESVWKKNHGTWVMVLYQGI